MQTVQKKKRLNSFFESLEMRQLLATITVTSTADSAATGTLRAAVEAANIATEPTTIIFDTSTNGPFRNRRSIVLTEPLDFTNIDFPTTITGPQAGLIISGGGDTQLLTIESGVSVSLNKLRFTEGGASATGGGGDGSGLPTDRGGAIYNAGILDIRNSTIDGSVADTMGGGLFNAAGAQVTLINDTFANNSASGNGGAIANEGTVSSINVTIAANDASRGGGISNATTATFSVGNTIMGGNRAFALNAGDIDGKITSRGYNFIGNSAGATGFAVTDLRGGTNAATELDPELSPTLAYNGGPTPTLLPLTGSLVIDHGSNILVPTGITTDQRGQTRIVKSTSVSGTLCDIGSVEVGPSSNAEADVFGRGFQIFSGSSFTTFFNDTDFGTVRPGVLVSHVFTLKNTGTGTLNTSGLTVPAGFIVTEGLKSTIAAGSFDTFTIKFDTSTTGTFSGDVSFTTNDTDENPYVFAIEGTCEIPNAPEVEMVGTGTHTIINNDLQPTTVDGTDFGTTEQGTAVTRTFTIKNTGIQPLVTTGLAVPAGFTIVGDLASTIAPGASDTFQIRMTAAAQGNFSGLVTFTTTDRDEAKCVFKIRGTVKAPTIPSAPTSLRTTAVTSSQINLAWTDGSTNETKFIIEVATDKNFTTGKITRTVVADVTKFYFTGLKSGTTYYIRVRAYNTAGYSASSNVLTQKTL